MELSMKRFPKKQCDSGFTLIELLIAIAVSGIVLAGLVSVFTTTNRAYTRQDETATLQQNLRVAKMNLERDIRMAGCGFGNTLNYLSGVGGRPNPNTIYPIANTNADPLNANSDSLTISYVNYSDPCCGVLPQLTPTAFVTGTSTFTVSADMNNPPAPPNPDYTLWNTGIAPCNNSGVPFFAVFTRSFPAGGTTLQSDVFRILAIVPGAPDSSLRCEGLSAGIPATPPANSSINFFSATQLVTVTYSFENATRTLRRNQQPANVNEALAEDIEDLQFAFGLDTDADGDVDVWINNAALVPAQQVQVRQVRVSILGRSANQISGQALNSRQAVEDNGTGAVSDHNLRQLLQFNVALRNMR
jgi:type IV pilus assembly protein PilW